MRARRSVVMVAAMGAVGLAARPAVAQEVTWHGQIRPRYEFRDPSGDGHDAFTSMRVRAGLDAALDPGVSVFIQLQDVRVWGEETSTLADFRADDFDLHQAYIHYRGRRLPWFEARVGRQETNLGGQRLVGAVDWTQQGRSFDGVRFDLTGGSKRVTAALLAYKLADATASTHTSDAEMYGAYATAKAVGPGDLDLYYLYDRALAADATRQSTFGARYVFAGALTGRVEGSLQRGDRAGAPVSAFMFGVRVGRAIAEGKSTATLWYDYLSGDGDPDDGETGVFSTLYATNHKFYGFADLFLDIPAQTGGRGLQDLALKVSWKPTGRMSVGADLHTFRAAEQGTLSTAHFADELDLTVSHQYTSHLALVAGLSLVRQDDALAEIGRLSQNMTWGYLMLNAAF